MSEEPGKPGLNIGLAASGAALFVIGLLILIPSGLCTGIFGYSGVVSGFQTGNWMLLAMTIGIGFIPVGIGLALVLGGLKLYRKS